MKVETIVTRPARTRGYCALCRTEIKPGELESRNLTTGNAAHADPCYFGVLIQREEREEDRRVAEYKMRRDSR